MKNIRSNSGQALIEYVLVLIVVLGLILGGLYQMNKAVQVWADAYFGEYLMCLMEAGELPTLGAPPSELESECRELYKPFNLADGDPLVGDKLSGEESSSGSGGSNNEGRAAASGRGGSAESNSFAGNSRSSGNRNGRASRFRSRGGDSGEEGDGISRENSSTAGGTTTSFDSDNGRPSRFAMRDENGRRGRGTRTKEEDGKAQKTKAKNVAQETQERLGPKLIPVSRAPTQSTEAPEIEELGIGGFLRYLIIAAIIIAIVIFIGGQALQVSKSMD